MALWERVFEAAAGAGSGGLGSWSLRSRLARVPRAAWPVVVGALARASSFAGRSLVVLAPSPERFFSDLRPWLASSPPSYLFAEVAVSFLDRPPAFDPAVARRLEALAALGSGSGPSVVVSSRKAMMRATVSPSALSATTVVLRSGLRADPVGLAERLVELGYSREALAEAQGQFSLRGGILDVFPAAASAPVRAEFFGDEIETLRLYDPQNQRSVMSVPLVTVRPGRELLLGPSRGAAAVERLRAGAGLSGLRGDVRSEWEDDLARLESGASFPGVELYAAYLDPELPSLLDHLPEGCVVVDIEPGRQLAEARELERETLTLAAAEAGDGELPRDFVPPMVPVDRLAVVGGGGSVVGGGSGAGSGGGSGASVGPPVVEVLAGEPADGSPFVDPGFVDLEPMVGRDDAPAMLRERAQEAAVVLASEQGERVSEFLEAGGSPPVEVDIDLDWEPSEGLWQADLDLVAGFAAPAIGLWIYSDAELFGRVRRPATRVVRGRRTEAPLSLEFQPGELVVHVDHGVARFVGMKLIESGDPSDGATRGAGAAGEVEREYLELEYAEGDRLFVPVENLDRIQKYLGGGDEKPALHRLGSGDWERARARARKSVQDVADELLRIYAQRETRSGFAFAPDTQWQQELEASFPYEETPDQLAALAEIKADMESDRPMDRLLCGDVGFGKTELALRAAFKAVMSGRQVALLAPTTVLAQQHFQVFSERLRGFPVTVEVLSRFRSDEEQKRTLAGLKAGAVDIVIGTHRLLSSDVRFKRLGLLIIDEEQRFGVMQKERLKRMRSNLDVLSLSATPIPRTLHMAVTGIRDMSVIQTPPEDRQPIKTYVTADEEGLVAEVVRRELDRGGQVYYVHNRVRTIKKAAERVRRLLPSARVAVGHGQMAEEELAQVMVDFAAGKYDVLVCTTIIESGLDIPNANTLVVERAEMFGLAQLYQLRGRVGRAGKRAYSYFMYDPRRSLTEAADKRLDVIQGLHELGLGFKIALRDLEIRGAGNLLGIEQHGAIAAVGFEMYLQMLQSTVARLRGGAEEEVVGDVLGSMEMNLDLPLDHFIPRSYIRDERLRLGAYRQLAAAADEAELEGVFASLRDRYGPAPAQLGNLAFSLRVKIRGQAMALRAVVAEGHDIVLRVDPDRVLDVQALVSRFPGRLSIAPNKIRLRRQGEGWRQDLLDVLDAMADLYGVPVGAGAASGSG